jgi:hypothetical protein
MGADSGEGGESYSKTNAAVTRAKTVYDQARADYEGLLSEYQRVSGLLVLSPMSFSSASQTSSTR